MKNVLILNLGTEKDILMSAHLTCALKDRDPAVNISMLISKKHFEVAKLVANISTIYTIDTHFINEIMKSELYPDTYALNEFTKSIEDILKTSWESVINYSDDSFSNYFMKAVNAKDIYGTYFDENGAIKTSNKWATLQKLVTNQSHATQISTPLIRNSILNLPLADYGTKLNINEDYLMMANQNFMKVRRAKSSNGQCHIVGLNLEVGYDGYGLNVDVMENIIEALEESDQFKIVLLTSDKSYQKEMLKQLNNKFNNKLISINVDIEALTAIVSNLDILVSAENKQLLVADSLDVKTIEVKSLEQNHSPAALLEGSAIIYDKGDEKIFNDIILNINEEFGSELPMTTLHTTNPTLHCIRDNYGVSYTQIRGEINLQKEIKKHIERSLLFQCMGLDKDHDLIHQIQNFIDKEEVEIYSKNVRNEITEVVKVLLTALRSLNGARSSKSQQGNFLKSLNELTEMSRENNFTAALLKYFVGNIENINSNNPEDNINKIESSLFELKAHLQLLMNLADDLVQKEENKKTPELNA